MMLVIGGGVGITVVLWGLFVLMLTTTSSREVPFGTYIFS